MKLRFTFLTLIIIVSILPFLPIFLNPNLPHTSDGEVQLPRMAAFFKAVQDGHIPVRWAGDLNYGYGMPLFIFIYHTPFYVSTILISLGVSLVVTFKIILFVSFLLSGIFMYLFTKEFFKDEKKAFFVTLLYQFAPYHLIDILTRGTIGTIYVYAFFPLILFGLTRLEQSKNGYNWKHLLPDILVTAFATTLTILSHNSMALIFFGVCLLFILFFDTTIKKKILAFFSLSIGLGISAFYWIPAMFEHKYTYGDLFMKDLFRVNFPPFQNFFIPNLFNSASLRISEIAVHWGIFHTIAVISGLLLFIRWKQLSIKSRKLLIFCFILIAFSVVLMNPVTTPVWERLSFLRQFQFPWRLLSLIVFASAMLGSMVFEAHWFKRQSVFIISCIVVIGATAFYWQPTQGYEKEISEHTIWNYPLNTTYFGETDVIWSAGPASAYPQSRIEVIHGKASVNNFSKKTQELRFTTVADTDARFASHTQYFPGWRVFVDNQKVPIEFQDQNWRGLITFSVPKGNHTIRIKFEETPIRFLANSISVASLLFIVIGTILIKNHKKT